MYCCFFILIVIHEIFHTKVSKRRNVINCFLIEQLTRKARFTFKFLLRLPCIFRRYLTDNFRFTLSSSSVSFHKLHSETCRSYRELIAYLTYFHMFRVALNTDDQRLYFSRYLHLFVKCNYSLLCIDDNCRRSIFLCI